MATPYEEEETREPAGDVGKLLRVVVSTPAGSATMLLPLKPAVTIGRTPGADVFVDDESVSRTHAVIRSSSLRTVEDADSRNGTFLNGRKLEPGEQAPLEAGDILRLGDATLVFQPWRANLGRAGAAPAAEVKPVFASPAMRKVLELLEQVARTVLPIMILGETGTGKDVLARTAHAMSDRASNPFVAINCAALPEGLLESELFGYERGAFTAAVNAKEGLFETANGGTLFLDEVGDLSLASQAKLLRVLEAGELTRVGGVKPRRVDVRIVSATNRSLGELVADRRFRDDLLYRLDGVTLTVPPLRERREDILELAELFAAEVNAKMGRRRAPTLEPKLVEILERRPWPGNVRELRRTIERMVMLSQTATLRAADLDALPTSASSARAVADSNPASGPRALREAKEHVERERILQALKTTSGNQTEAAKLLGIGRRTLITKIEQFGIARPRKRAPSAE